MTDFGGKLRQERERRGISLRQISANTKIGVAVLEALERNDVSKLPGGIFSRGFVRSYAVEVGLDPDETVREFLERFHGEPAPEPQLHVAVSEREDALAQRHDALMLGGKVLAAIAILVAIVLYFAFKDRRTPADVAAAGSMVESAVAPGAAAPAAAAPPAVPDRPPVSGPMRLELRPTGSCWVRLVVDGETVLARVMEAGERQTVTVRDAATIDVGNAGAFAFSVDGRPGRSLGAEGEVKTVRLTRDTLAQHLR